MPTSIYDMDYKEIAALTHEQVKMFIDIEAAQKGFPLLPTVGPQPEKPTATPTQSYYGVAGLYFENAEDALEVLRLLSGKKVIELDHKWDIGVNVARQRASYQDSEREIKAQVAFTPEEYDAQKQTLEAYRSAKTEYERQEKAFNDAVSTRQNVSDSVWELYRAANLRISEEARIAEHFTRYTEMLDGNARNAAKMVREVIPNMGLELDHTEYLDALLGDRHPEEKAA